MIRNALKQLLDAFDSVAQHHEEIGDSEVRERMASVIHNGLIVVETGYHVPAKFGMFSSEGNKRVRTALEDFLAHPEVEAALGSLPTPEARLAAFQDVGAISSEGTTYDEYFGHTTQITKTPKALDSALAMNLTVLKKSRRAPHSGDIFVMLPPDGLYLYGRVISTNANGGFSLPSNLIYVYQTRSSEKIPVPELRLEHLLLPPIVTNKLPWSEGYFEFVEHQDLASKDQLPQHCFVDPGGRFFDEQYNRLPGPIEPVGEAGIFTLSGIDKKISKALGIPLAQNAK